MDVDLEQMFEQASMPCSLLTFYK